MQHFPHSQRKILYESLYCTREAGAEWLRAFLMWRNDEAIILKNLHNVQNFIIYNNTTPNGARSTLSFANGRGILSLYALLIHTLVLLLTTSIPY